ncbi:Ohr family peroxiredoxin [Psychrobacter sp. I-STPA6b]|uniref:Ohr family peroxiredoxin n=1 Tax=Psychrobacter sp. I-STPA6b TaxID=2585718 RepID=UPI001D0C2154|nr:Ohr family peroxiredoxin [Psychrobacter sp. I-STPA6b]
MSILYETQATVTGGREGVAKLNDSDLTVNLVPPGSKKDGNNPEQLFAIGYASCFDSALNVVKQQSKVKFDSETQVTIQLNKFSDTDYGLSGRIHVIASNTELSADEVQKAVETAHQVCPYSKATKGNIDISVTSEVK